MIIAVSSNLIYLSLTTIGMDFTDPLKGKKSMITTMKKKSEIIKISIIQIHTNKNIISVTKEQPDTNKTVNKISPVSDLLTNFKRCLKITERNKHQAK